MEESDGVLFMGASVMDLITYTSRFPKPGETLVGKHFQKGFGGKGGNACVAGARMGLRRPAIITKIGDDQFGRELLENYKANDISTEGIVQGAPGESSSAATIVVTENGQNSIVYVGGAQDSLTGEDIVSLSALFKKSKLFVPNFECQPDALLSGLRVAKQFGVQTLVNLAPPFPGEFDGEIIRLCDILCLNEGEAEVLTKTPITSVEEAKTAIPLLISLGCRTAIITLGANGAVYGSAGNSNIEHVPAKQTTAVDTTGAGDAFLGAFAYYLTRHGELAFREKVKRSCHFASVSVERKGTQTSYPHRGELASEFFE